MATVKVKDLHIKNFLSFPKDAVIRFLDEPMEKFFFFDYLDLTPRKKLKDGECDLKKALKFCVSSFDDIAKMSITSVDDQLDLDFDDAVQKANTPAYSLLFRNARTNFFNDVHRENELDAEMFKFKQMYSLDQDVSVEDPVDTMLLPPSKIGVENFKCIVERAFG